MKKRLDQFWRTFDFGQILFHPISQRLVFSQGSFGGAVMTKMIPDKFIRIQIRGIARQEMQFQFSFEGLHIGGHQFGFMGRQPIDHQKHPTAAVTHKRFQKFHEPGGVQAAGINRIPKGSAGGHRGDGTDRLALTTGLDDRRLALGAPGALQRRVRTNAGFIQKEDVRPALFGPFLQLRIILRLPFFHGLRVAFSSPAANLEPLLGDWEQRGFYFNDEGWEPGNNRGCPRRMRIIKRKHDYGVDYLLRVINKDGSTGGPVWDREDFTNINQGESCETVESNLSHSIRRCTETVVDRFSSLTQTTSAKEVVLGVIPGGKAVETQGLTGLCLDPQTEDMIYLLVQDRRREPVIRDTDPHHSSEDRQRLINRNLVALQAKVIGHRKT